LKYYGFTEKCSKKYGGTQSDLFVAHFVPSLAMKEF